MSEVEPIVQLKDVGVTYSRRIGLLKSKQYVALRSVSFSLFKGESLGVIGDNGAGKSTLLKVLNGTIQPNSGSIVNHGYSIAQLTLKLGFDAKLSGRDNAILSGLLMGFKKQEILNRMGEIAAISGVQPI